MHTIKTVEMKNTSFGEGLKRLIHAVSSQSDPDPPLHIAAKNGDLGEIMKYLAEEMDVNVEDENGQTPLYVASLFGHTEIVEALLNRGADQRACPNRTPLHVANNAPVATLLIKAGGNVNVSDLAGDTPLHVAVRKANPELVSALLEQSAEVNAKSKEGLTPLHYALEDYRPNFEIIHKLIDAGSEVNSIDLSGKTPLHHHCDAENPSSEILTLLLSKGCELEVKDFKGNYPIHIAVSNYALNENFLKLLCQNSGITNLKDSRGRTPLMLAVQAMSLNIVENLLKLGADISSRDFHGRSALHHVTDAHNTEEIVNLMVSSDADLNAEDDWGRSPLQHTIYHKHTTTALYLLKLGAFVNHGDKCGVSALHLACYRRLESIVKELVEHGADVNKSDKAGSTALHAAAFAKHKDVVKYLLGKSANAGARDINGMTPSQIAKTFWDEEVTTLLEGKTAEVTSFSNFANICLSLEEINSILQEGKFKRSIVNLPEYYQKILSHPTLGNGLEDTEAQEIHHIIEKQMQYLAEKITELDNRFKCVLLHAGSSSEGTKSKFPDEFDFMFSLETFSDHCQFEFVKEEDKQTKYCYSLNNTWKDDTNSDDETYGYGAEDEVPVKEFDRDISLIGYIRVSVKDDSDSNIFRLSKESTGPMCPQMNHVFSQLVERAVFSEHFPKDPRLIPLEVTVSPSLSYAWSGSKYKDIIIDVDLVPAVTLPEWPTSVDRNSAIFTDDLRQIRVMAVAKVVSDLYEDEWRCSLALTETAIFRKLRPELRNAYILCKSLMSSDILPAVDFGDITTLNAKKQYIVEHPDMTGDTFTLHDRVEDMVPSYILKMTFLSLIEEKILESGEISVYKKDVSADNKHGEAEAFSRYLTYGPAISLNKPEKCSDVDCDLVRNVIQRSVKFISERFVPSVFNKQQNVLKERFLFEVDGEKALLFLRLVAELIKE